MVKDNVNYYFDSLLKDLQSKYSSLKGGQVFKATPPSFPYMYFKQIGGEGALSTLSNLRSAEDCKFRERIHGRNWISLRLFFSGGECERYVHITVPYKILKIGNMINSAG